MATAGAALASDPPAATADGRAAVPWAARLLSPVRTRRGRFAPLKAVTFALLWLPALNLAARYAADSLGARPVLALVHGTGLWTVRLLLIALALTPARWLLDWPGSTALRRMIGVAAAAYALAHLGLYTAQQNFHLLHVVTEIIHRFYLLIGLVALTGLIALAATSTDARVRALGRRWKQLHRLTYPIGALALLHFFLQSKADVSQAVIMAGLFIWLMAWRLVPATLRDRVWTAAALGAAATLATAGVEIAWYGLATRIDIDRVWRANFQFLHWRPSAYVALSALAAILVILLRKLTPLPAPAPQT